MSHMLNALREQREAKMAEARGLLDGEPTPEALETVEARNAEIAALDEQIKSVEETEARAAVISESRASAGVAIGVQVSEPSVYSEHSERSYFLDLANAHIRNDQGAWDNLRRHAAEVRANDRVDGNGGEFVPPAWLTDLYAKTVRPARVTADLLTKLALPAGTDSVNIPRITTGYDVAAQTADGAAITSQDMVTTSVAAPVRTIAGEAILAQQLLDQSPLRGGIDQMVYTDLMAAYDYKLNAQVIQGVGTAGQMTGILNTAGIGTVSAAGTVAVGSFGTAIAQAISTVAKSRYEGAEAVVMHPSLWYALVGAVDGNGRSLVVPTANGPWNAIGVNQNPGAAAGVAGTVLGMPVYLDASIDAVSSAYPVIVAKFSDTVLMESGPRTRVVLGDTTGSQLQVRFQLWNYAAIAARYPSGIAKVTGVIPSTGY